jgi:DeoR/GlpR family transcriptional regulator of sugar metabolism
MDVVDVRERHQHVLELLERTGRVDVSALAGDCTVSEMTVRRDLEQLERLGCLRRVHGGAVLDAPRGLDAPFAVRRLRRVEAKRRIAAKVAELLRDGESVVLDSGTTVLEVARALTDRRLLVMALSLHVADVMADARDVRLLVAGGEVRQGERSFTGAVAEHAVASLRYDTTVLGVGGLDAGGDGVTDYDLAEVRVKQLAARLCRRTLVATDSTKLDQVAVGHVCDLDAVDVVVTDTDADEAYVDRLRSAGVGVHCA